MESSVLFLLGAAIFVGGILLSIITLTKKGTNALDVNKYRERWLAIEQSVNESPASWQLAIMNADKLLDQALKESGRPGATMGERLKNSKGKLSELNAVWSAHKLRNKLAHEDEVKLDRRMTNGALKTFKRALRETGAL